MDYPDAITLIRVRKLKPRLSVAFPAPGVYLGQIKIILPDLDRCFVSRTSESGSEPVVLEFNVATPITAKTIFAMLEENRLKLYDYLQDFASPIHDRQLEYMQLPSDHTRTKHKYIKLSNPRTIPG